MLVRKLASQMGLRLSYTPEGFIPYDTDLQELRGVSLLAAHQAGYDPIRLRK
jgi:hypothetical protein